MRNKKKSENIYGRVMSSSECEGINAHLSATECSSDICTASNVFVFCCGLYFRVGHLSCCGLFFRVSAERIVKTKLLRILAALASSFLARWWRPLHPWVRSAHPVLDALPAFYGALLAARFFPNGRSSTHHVQVANECVSRAATPDCMHRPKDTQLEVVGKPIHFPQFGRPAYFALNKPAAYNPQ